jgi:hypothetical protein
MMLPETFWEMKKVWPLPNLIIIFAGTQVQQNHT